MIVIAYSQYAEQFRRNFFPISKGPGTSTLFKFKKRIILRTVTSAFSNADSEAIAYGGHCNENYLSSEEPLS